MKQIIILSIFIVIYSLLGAQEVVKPGPNIKDIEGHPYKTVFIGNQHWMADNLNTSKYNDGTKIQNLTNRDDWSSCVIGSWVYYNNDQKNEYLGKLYSWYTVSKAYNGNKNVCPSGWKVPSKDDFDELINYLGGKEVAGQKMKSLESPTGWKTNVNFNKNTNTSKFSAVAGGSRGFASTNTTFNYDFGFKTLSGNYWTSTLNGGSEKLPYFLELSYEYDNASLDYNLYSMSKSNGYSVRCISSKTNKLINNDLNSVPQPIEKKAAKNLSSNSIKAQGKFGPVISDVDGNSYKTVFIGTQQWMAENLKTSKYNDGTSIQKNKQINENNKEEIASWYDYNEDSVKSAKFGHLYNWHVVNKTTNGNRNICPKGWHVPADKDWTILSNFLGGESIAGIKMKEPNTSNWISSNNENANASLFSSLPSGCLNPNNSYDNIGLNSFFWSSTEYFSNFAWGRSLDYTKGIFSRVDGVKEMGLSIRCVSSKTLKPEIINEDSITSIPAHIEQSNFAPPKEEIKLGPNIKDIEGHPYKTVFIGNQHWMADNLNTSKYNDGTKIQNLTNRDDWSSCVIGSWVYYNNDQKNEYLGKLYSWYTVSKAYNGNKNVCPSGWKVPSKDDFDELINYLGGKEVAGQKMKSLESPTGWKTNVNFNKNTNTSKFSAVAGGSRGFASTNTTFNYDFGFKTLSGNYWTSTLILSEKLPYFLELSYEYDNASLDYDLYSMSKSNGYSVRCIKEKNSK